MNENDQGVHLFKQPFFSSDSDKNTKDDSKQEQDQEKVISLYLLPFNCINLHFLNLFILRVYEK